MKQELEDKIIRDCPNLYRDAGLDEMQSCMHWGLGVGGGWEPLLRECSEKLEALIIAIPEKEREQYRASQVKEKFGTLRFYMNSETEEMSDVIKEAERKSCITCENCGQPGKSRSGGWIKTLCDDCVSEKEEHKRLVSELIPCHFCKGTRLEIELVHFHHWACECLSCDARGPVCVSKLEAFQKWNQEK